MPIQNVESTLPDRQYTDALERDLRIKDQRIEALEAAVRELQKAR